MRLAFYTYSFTDRLEMAIEPVLRRIAATGYDGIDVSGTHGKSDDPKSVTPEIRRLTRETAQRLKLRVEAVITHAELTTSLYTERPLDLDGSADLAVELGAPVVTFHMGGVPETLKEKPAAAARREVRQRVVDYLKKAVAYADARHVRLAVDGIWPTWIVDTPESFLQLCDDIGGDTFGVNFDPCYLVLMGLDPVAVCKQWKQRIVHAHLKDHVGRYPKWEHRIPGRGEMDYGRVVAGLKEIGFREAIAVETFTDMKFEEACDVGLREMRAAMKRAGLG